jgi:pyruvoyl-dependent arginine decarboxylase (PvlArgDC)
LLGATLAASLAGCASDRTNEAGDEMSSALSTASAENERHAGACRSTASMADLLTDVDRHIETMTGLMSRMDSASDHMRTGSEMSMHCSGIDFDRMSRSLTDLHSEVARHSGNMNAMPTLDVAQMECAAYTGAMRSTMRSMQDDLGAMTCMQM